MKIRFILVLIFCAICTSCSNKMSEKFDFADLEGNEIFDEKQKSDIKNYFIQHKHQSFKNLELKESERKRGGRLSNPGDKSTVFFELDSSAYEKFSREKILDSVQTYLKRLSDFEEWKALNAKNIDSTLSINLKKMNITSDGDYELCMQVKNRSNKTVARYRGQIIVKNKYFDTVVTLDFLSDEMSTPYVKNQLYEPLDYINSREDISSCFRFLFQTPAPNSWIKEINGKNIYASDEQLNFVVNTIVFADGTVLKR